jgi:2-polyprenyl-3-methyl-5-hydroxy-6-metoxy-1,4-benzoquinol methylase
MAKEALKATYNKIAEDWFKDHNGDTWWQKETDYLISLLPAKASILDIGCGAGHKTKYFKEKGFVVTGGDFSEKMVEIATREVPEASFKVIDLYTLDTLAEQFDCVFAQAVLLHISKKDVPLVLQNIKHVLKPNGLLYIAVKEVWPETPAEEILEEHDYGYTYERFFSYFTTPELEAFLRKSEFSIVHSTIERVGKTNWIQIIAKV